MKIRAEHIFHPIRATRRLQNALRMRWDRREAAAFSRNAPREKRNQCWCGGDLLPFSWHGAYGVCAKCGCYVYRRPLTPEAMKKLYSFDFYWHTSVQSFGQPSIEQRTSADLKDGRIEYWISLIERYGPKSGRVVEVGCAHAVLLARLRDRGYECVGLEPDAATAQWASRQTGIDVRAGFFPETKLPECDIFMAYDVIEHSREPLAFLKAARNLLRPGGVAIIQTPIDRYQFAPPFGDRFNDAFKEPEHLYLFTDPSMTEMVKQSGLEVLNMTERLWLHHEIVVLRRQG